MPWFRGFVVSGQALLSTPRRPDTIFASHILLSYKLTCTCLVLHDQLLAAQHHLQGGRPQGAPGQQQQLQPNTASPRDQPNIDPAISGSMLGAPQTPTQPQGSPPSDGGSKSYGKRELSTSKRAAQNRAAQVCLA
jgi:hypothetical protein